MDNEDDEQARKRAARGEEASSEAPMYFPAFLSTPSPEESAGAVWRRLGQDLFPEGSGPRYRGRLGGMYAPQPRRLGLPRAQVLHSIARASDLLGLPLETSLKMAWIESRWNPDAHSPTSSAAGLFQAIDSTAGAVWAKLKTMKTVDGRNLVDVVPELNGPYNPNDPFHSSLIGVAYAIENRKVMEPYLNTARSILGLGDSAADNVRLTNATTYLSHFLGTGGAKIVLAYAASNPQASLVAALDDIRPGLGSATVSANQLDPTMTVADIIKWADRHMNAADVTEAVRTARTSEAAIASSESGMEQSKGAIAEPGVRKSPPQRDVSLLTPTDTPAPQPSAGVKPKTLDEGHTPIPAAS